MSAHVQMECTKNDCGGSCAACCLAWCSVCGGGEAGLPTHCPGVKMNADLEEAVARGETNYADDLGWHAPTSPPAPPRFEARS